MWRILCWGIAAYAVIAWDTSCHPLHVRWPSMTAIYLVLMTRWAPKFGPWGGGLCGLIHDAASGGRIGLRLISATIAMNLAQHGMRAGSAESPWKQILLVSASICSWLVLPVALELALTGVNSAEIPRQLSPLSVKSISTILMTLVILTIAPGREAER